MCVRGVTRMNKHQSNNSNSKNSFKLENTKQISGFNPSFHQHHLGGNKEEGSKVLTFSLHIRSYPPRLHVTRDCTSKAGSCLLGARFKLLILLGFTVIWHLEILLNTPVNAIILQFVVSSNILTPKVSIASFPFLLFLSLFLSWRCLRILMTSSKCSLQCGSPLQNFFKASAGSIAP